MSQQEIIQAQQIQQLQNLHVSTCMLMTRFINGHHCPKLSHSIVHKLRQLISFSQAIEMRTNQEMYLELLEHWQKVTQQLLEQRENRKIHIAKNSMATHEKNQQATKKTAISYH